MKHYKSTDMTRRSGDMLEDALHAPVSITKYRKPKYVLMSAKHYEALVKGRDGREVFTLDTVPDDVRAEMLAGIEQELSHE